ncbi:MAG: hypothetical protein WCY15_11790 [Phenylobacterium sp.]|uniref:hypothetical protein n=2 Tax=Phenylobacterium sp. TaxID=1871053 RepID=UPI002A2EA6ED|nr:hypothetical protein [Phenylobacterium sp.]
MDRLIPGKPRSALRTLALLGGALATAAAVTVGAVLAVFFAATMLVIAVMSSVLLMLAGAALRARRTARAKAGGANGVIEAHNVGGHHWVAYGWSERPSGAR